MLTGAWFHSSSLHNFRYGIHFFGDIFVYQRHQLEIHQRIWNKIAQYAANYGTEQKPINVIAHSLGGVVAFDAALDKQQPLWIKRFITFGSQSSFFHIFDPRTGLAQYTHDLPVTLPPTIQQWTNLWDPMDLLAFAMSSVFLLHDGKPPLDIPIHNSTSRIIYSKGWTHSLY